MNFEQFQHDKKTIRAVEREFEIIGEAVKTQQPGDSSPSRTPNAPPAILPPAPPPRGASPDTKIPVSANTAK
ncbi:MAG: hypothetical protein D3919_00765 [Candidatus Electrothrix sp. AW5]|nr:hypothetical protein [Candidatus Electrothrix sp. AX1]MCI5181449.1 hypothetical protein [Candidatus Electrothrix gigas]MCI5194769.1 hypothetical protein [Candidatus Electrothrix gigas]